MSGSDKNILAFSLRVLHANHLDLEVVAVTGDLIAADARFNLWFTRTAKPRDDEELVLGLMETYDECVAILEPAVQRFMDDRARDELLEVERDLMARLKAAMA